MTPKEFAHATMLVASLRTRLGHANALTAAVTAERDDLAKQLAAHVESLTLSNAQCSKLLVQNEQLTAELDRMKGDPLPIKLVGKLKDVETSNKTLHSELVEVRAALASVTEQRDSLQRTLDEWSNADTEPHDRVTAEDVADHVVPPVLPLCNVCHGCGTALTPYGTVLRCPNQICGRTTTGTLALLFNPYHDTCKSSTPVRHE